ncbi:unnamed protein product [Cuscuta campestris]|uniref:Uncharacterized protein n=1 Tax=Cuscuta campestris TaxID=132261 RepID=A0A484N4M7_9ASTE|nr:unnamed protein product [Cuscuta campestris]
MTTKRNGHLRNLRLELWRNGTSKTQGRALTSTDLLYCRMRRYAYKAYKIINLRAYILHALIMFHSTISVQVTKVLALVNSGDIEQIDKILGLKNTYYISNAAAMPNQV